MQKKKVVVSESSYQTVSGKTVRTRSRAEFGGVAQNGGEGAKFSAQGIKESGGYQRGRRGYKGRRPITFLAAEMKKREKPKEN